MSNSLQISQSWTWLPTKISGCTAWWDAQDSSTVTLSGPSNVSSWADKSGQGNIAATGAASPTYITGSGIVFNGTSQYLTTAYTANPLAESLFIVATWTGTSPLSYELIGASGTNGRQYAIKNSGSSNTVQWEAGGTNPTGYGATSGVVANAQFLTTGTYRPIAGGSTSLNGSNQSTRGAISFPGPATTNIGVGFTTGLSNYFQGTINEIIIYSREVSTDERQQVEGYLAYKWDLQSNLPSTHPYKINPPFQNTIILPTVPSGPILLSKATPSAQFSGATNKITANVFTPLSLSNYGPPCLYWYDAQDSTTVILDQTNYVVGWNDKSGNGYNLLSNPAINTPLNYQTDSNNFKYITGQGLLSYIGPVNFEVTSFFIMYSDELPQPGDKKYVFGAIPEVIANSEDSLGGFIFQSSNDGPPSGPFETSFFSGSRTTYTSNNFGSMIPLTMFEFNVNQREGERERDPSTIIQTSWVNGFSSNGASFEGVRLSTSEGISLGGFYTFGTPTVSQIGSVYELIGVSGPITEEARQKMTAYYAWKYGQKPNIPQDNPYLVIPARGTP
jgi:hypothetical protein